MDGSRFGFSQVRLELGEGHFDGIEVGAVGRQEQEPCAAFLEDGLGLLAFVAGEIVEDDHVAGFECRGELGFDIGLEETPVHRRIDHPGCSEPVMAQRGDEGLRSPMAEGRRHPEPLPPARPAAQAGHLGRRPGFVDEHQPLRAFLHPGLTMRAPHPPRPGYVSAIGFARQQRFF